MVQGGDQLVDGLRAEGVAHLGPVEGDPDDAGVDRAVVGQVVEVEALDRLPGGAVEDLGDVVAGGHACNLAERDRLSHSGKAGNRRRRAR